MDFQEWVEKYKPLTDDDGKPHRFDTFGSALEFVSQQNEKNVWTMVSTDGERSIVSGTYRFNRDYYYVTEIAWEEFVSVELPEDEEIWLTDFPALIAWIVEQSRPKE